MVFSSMFFIYFFFPISMILYCAFKNIKARNIVLLLSSMFFYSWAGPKYLLVLLSLTFVIQ